MLSTKDAARIINYNCLNLNISIKLKSGCNWRSFWQHNIALNQCKQSSARTLLVGWDLTAPSHKHGNIAPCQKPARFMFYNMPQVTKEGIHFHVCHFYHRSLIPVASDMYLWLSSLSRTIYTASVTGNRYKQLVIINNSEFNNSFSTLQYVNSTMNKLQFFKTMIHHHKIRRIINTFSQDNMLITIYISVTINKLP